MPCEERLPDSSPHPDYNRMLDTPSQLRDPFSIAEVGQRCLADHLRSLDRSRQELRHSLPPEWAEAGA